MQKPYSITAYDLASLGFEGIPEELKSSGHLIYSSPATLVFNSPGAQGFGVKRAALAIPGSVELLVAPICCGRNTTMQSRLSGYADRFYYLLQDDTDIVTGRHLNRIQKAVKEIVDSREEKPSCVMICITCVDALLGTDMERVCKKASEYAGVPVLPSYMYALEREGRVPPMTAIRRTVFSLLEPRRKKSTTVNLIGEFAPFDDDCELYDLLKEIGIKKINEIARCTTFAEYQSMSEANFNMILNPQARLAADDFMKRLGIPSVELTRMYRIEKIRRQYELFGKAIGAVIDDRKYYDEARSACDAFRMKYAGKCAAIGECMNADCFELALAMTELGVRVTEIYGTVSDANFPYIRLLANVSPETKIFTNLSPSMIHYSISETPAGFTLGMDSSYYQPKAVNVPFNEEIQPFGYRGLIHLLTQIDDAMRSADNCRMKGARI